MIGHVGNKVGALVDGQLPQPEAEKLWSHVMSCAACHSAVEREGWVKTRLAGLRHDACQPEAPNYLRAVLSDPPRTAAGHAGVNRAALGQAEVSGASRRHPVAVAVLGAGSVGAAVIGVLALTVPAQAPAVDRRGPVTSLTRTTESPATAHPVSATGGSVSAPLSNDTEWMLSATADAPLPQWVRISK